MLKRLMAGLGLSGLVLAVTILGQILIVPILLAHWGAQVYGEWLTLTNLVSNLNVLNLGVQTYVLNILINHRVNGEIEAGTRVLHAALRLYTILCSLIILIVFALALLPGLLDWLNIHTISSNDTRLIIIIQGFLTAYAIVGGILAVLLIANNQYPRRLIYSFIDRIILLAVPTLIAFIGGSPLWAMLSIGILTVIVIPIQLWDVRRQSPFALGLSKTTWHEVKALIFPSLSFFAVSISNVLLSSGIILVISSSVDAQAVTLYSTNLMLTNFLVTIMSQGLNIIWPEITAAAATKDDPQRLARWYQLASKMTNIVSILAAAGIAVIGSEVLDLWTSGRIQLDENLNLLLVVYFLFRIPDQVSRVFGLATNHQNELLRIDLVKAVLSIIFAIVFAQIWGLIGIVLALVLWQFFATIAMLFAACRWTVTSWSSFVYEGFLRGFLPIMSLGILSFVLSYYFSAHLLVQLLAMIFASSLYVYLVWHFWLNSWERSLARQLAFKFLGTLKIKGYSNA